MAIALEQKLKAINDIDRAKGDLVKLLLDNKITEGKAKSTALKALVDALDTAIQASSNFHSLS